MTNHTRRRRVTPRQVAELHSELERERGRLREQDPREHVIADALLRIRDGTYGECERCREPIPYGRLSVMPETRYCVECSVMA